MTLWMWMIPGGVLDLYEELVELKNQINLAMWNSEEWQEVTVPAGIYLIGTDIPAGTWNITASPKIWDIDVTIGYMKDGSFAYNYSSDVYHIYGKENSLNSEGKPYNVVLTLQEGSYLRIRDGAVIFTPFSGYDFGFKK